MVTPPLVEVIGPSVTALGWFPAGVQGSLGLLRSARWFVALPRLISEVGSH